MDLASINWGMILGGFGLFMFGITFMGDGLKVTMGDKLRDYIDQYTTNPISALLIGVLLTIIMQSSSATSAIAIGLVRADLMTLSQACGIILGANIGTTVTSFLISVKIDKYAMFIVFVGALLICFSKKQMRKNIGNVVLGFGLIFYGMSAMSTALSALKDLPEFTSFAIAMSENPLLSMFAGILLTAAVQSSAATIGVMQNLYNVGAVSFSAAIPFMFGADIGTTATGILASIGGSTAGKRTAFFHTTINIIGSIFGMLLLQPFCSMIINVFGNFNPMMQIAFANIVFKVVSTLLVLPFLKYFVLFVKKIIPEKETEKKEQALIPLDITKALPSASLLAAKDCLLTMSDLVKQMILQTKDFLNIDASKEKMEEIIKTETNINNYDKQITDHLIKLSVTSNLTNKDKIDIRIFLDICKNLERIGDLSMNLGEFYQMSYQDNKHSFTHDAKKDMNEMYQLLLQMLELSKEVFITNSNQKDHELLELENQLDDMEMNAREAHFVRMSTRQCNGAVSSSVYCDILGTIERMGDHCCSISRATLRPNTADLSSDEQFNA